MAAKPALVGGFILGGLALGILALLFSGGLRLFQSTSQVVVYFRESVAGLEIGAPVTFHGVRVGSVESIELHVSSSNLTARIPVILKLELDKIVWDGQPMKGRAEDYRRFVAAGLRAQLAQQNLFTGQAEIDLSFRPGTPQESAGPSAGLVEIPTIASDYAQIRNELSDLPMRALLESADHAFLSIKKLADDFDAKLDPLAKNMDDSFTSVRLTMNVVARTVSALKPASVRSLRGIDLLTSAAHRQLDQRGGELSATLAHLDQAAREAAILVDSLNSLTGEGARFRDDLESSSHDLSATARSLRRLSDSVEHNPGLLLWGRAGQ